MEFTQYITVHDMYKAYIDSIDIESVSTGCQCIDGICMSASCLCYRSTSVNLECSDACKCSPITCSNRVVSSGTDSDSNFMIIDMGLKGKGVISPIELPADTYITCYSGEILNNEEANLKLESLKSSGKATYILSVSEYFNYETEKLVQTHIDASEIGNFSRYFNHSCVPNMKIKIIRTLVSDIPYIAFFTSRDIAAGEELTFNYNIDGNKGLDVTTSKVICRCGHKECTGFLPKHLAP